MIKRILKIFGIGGAVMASSCSQPAGPPYKNPATTLIYELLFCDRLDLYRENYGGEPALPWTVLFDESPDLEAVARIAKDDTNESRVRMLAFNLLREAGKEVPRKVLLGTIIEVRLPEGLDTLAVFADGSARYINHSGKMTIVEGPPSPFREEIQRVIAASRPIVQKIGPWDKDRLPPPSRGNIRMTFLVSDGLYFGEGPMDVMQEEQMAAPLVDASTALLVKLVKRTLESERANPRGME